MRPLILFVAGLVLMVLFAVNQPGDTIAQERCPNGQYPLVEIPKSAPVPTVSSPAIDAGSCESGQCTLQPSASSNSQVAFPQAKSGPRLPNRVRAFVRQPFGGFFRRVFGR